jgi:hypothetical protein
MANTQYDLVFIAAAIGEKYEDFLVPCAFFALINNKNSFVEMIVSDPKNFMVTYKKEIEMMVKITGHHFKVRNYSRPLNNNPKGVYRFYEVPTVRAKYTYIIDIDIMFLDNILSNYLVNWPKNNKPYNNMIRVKDKTRLTGVQLVRTNDYYTPQFLKCIDKFYNMNIMRCDEAILYDMCKEVHGLVEVDFKFRPILGVHFSPNRGPGKKMVLSTSKRYYDMFMDISKKYPELFKCKIFERLLTVLKSDFKLE